MRRVFKTFCIVGLVMGSALMSACDNSDGGTCTYDVPKSVHSANSWGSARVFFPCDMETTSGSFDATTVSGGAFNNKEDMYWLAEYLRNEGDFIVIAMSASSNLSISSYESSHKAGVGILKTLNTSTGIFTGKIDSIAVMGYSMGGAGSLQAAHDLGDGIDAAIGLAAWSTSSNLSGIRVPTAVIVGTGDTTASPRMVHNTFGNIPGSVPKAYGEISGASHLFWVNNNNGSPAKEYIMAWLKVYLSGDTAYQGQLFFPSAGIVSYEYNP